MVASRITIRSVRRTATATTPYVIGSCNTIIIRQRAILAAPIGVTCPLAKCIEMSLARGVHTLSFLFFCHILSPLYFESTFLVFGKIPILSHPRRKNMAKKNFLFGGNYWRHSCRGRCRGECIGCKFLQVFRESLP